MHHHNLRMLQMDMLWMDSAGMMYHQVNPAQGTLAAGPKPAPVFPSLPSSPLLSHPSQSHPVHPHSGAASQAVQGGVAAHGAVPAPGGPGPRCARGGEVRGGGAGSIVGGVGWFWVGGGVLREGGGGGRQGGRRMLPSCRPCHASTHACTHARTCTRTRACTYVCTDDQLKHTVCRAPAVHFHHILLILHKPRHPPTPNTSPATVTIATSPGAANTNRHASPQAGMIVAPIITT